MTQFTFTSERKAFHFGWSRDVLIGDKEYHVVVQRGKSVRIPFRPRGKNMGNKWNASVYLKGGGRVWGGEVRKSTGVRGLLIAAGLIKENKFIIRGRSIDGTIYWAFSWYSEARSAKRFNTREEAQSQINYQLKRNKDVDADSIIGHLKIVEV